MIIDFDEISIPVFLTKLLEWRGFALMSIFGYSFYLTQFLLAFYNVGKNKTPLYLETVADLPIEVVGCTFKSHFFVILDSLPTKVRNLTNLDTDFITAN
jgi:hypothetical protein